MSDPSALPADIQDTPIADPEAVKDFWLRTVKPIADIPGRLDKVPTKKASTPREAETARIQNYHLTRKVFGMPDGYERITWRGRQQ